MTWQNEKWKVYEASEKEINDYGHCRFSIDANEVRVLEVDDEIENDPGIEEIVHKIANCRELYDALNVCYQLLKEIERCALEVSADKLPDFIFRAFNTKSNETHIIDEICGLLKSIDERTICNSKARSFPCGVESKNPEDLETVDDFKKFIENIEFIDGNLIILKIDSKFRVFNADNEHTGYVKELITNEDETINIKIIPNEVLSKSAKKIVDKFGMYIDVVDNSKKFDGLIGKESKFEYTVEEDISDQVDWEPIPVAIWDKDGNVFSNHYNADDPNILGNTFHFYGGHTGTKYEKAEYDMFDAYTRPSLFWKDGRLITKVEKGEVAL